MDEAGNSMTCIPFQGPNMHQFCMQRSCVQLMSVTDIPGTKAAGKYLRQAAPAQELFQSVQLQQLLHRCAGLHLQRIAELARHLSASVVGVAELPNTST